MRDDGTDAAIEALQAVRLVHRAYASGPEATKRIQDIAESLAMNDREGGMNGGICYNTAVGILKAFGGDVEKLKKPY